MPAAMVTTVRQFMPVCKITASYVWLTMVTAHTAFSLPCVAFTGYYCHTLNFVSFITRKNENVQTLDRFSIQRIFNKRELLEGRTGVTKQCTALLKLP